MTHSNNLSPLPFYESLDEQDSKKWWAFGDIYPLIVPNDTLIPFFFRVTDSHTLTLDNIKVYKMCCRPLNQAGDFNYDFSNDFYIDRDENVHYWLDEFSTKIHVVAGTGYTDVYYLGDAEDLPFEKGRYYMEFIFKYTVGSTSSYISVYSEVFTCVEEEELSQYTKIVWKNLSSLDTGTAIIPYTAGYMNILYLDTDVCQPTYEYEEEGDTRDGYFFPLKQISYKKYTFNIVAPEYMCDAMRLIRMSDSVTIKDKKGFDFDVSQFIMDVSWLEGGHYASGECEFTTDTVIKTIGKAVNI